MGKQLWIEHSRALMLLTELLTTTALQSNELLQRYMYSYLM